MIIGRSLPVARNHSGNVLGILALGVATVAGGAAIGYFMIGGVRPSPPSSDAAGIQEAPVPAGPAAAPAPAPHKTARAARANSDYTAPGAPRVHIVEDKTPTLNDSAARPRGPEQSSASTDTADIPTPDVEASQQGTDASRPAAPSNAVPGSDTPPAAKTSPDSEAGQAGAPRPATPRPSSDADYEHVNGTPPADSEASQAGGSGKATSHASYRVQAGSFADAGNARDYVNSLHDRGYAADLHPERQGDKTIYKVQVGAYRSRAAAADAAADFRQKGVPVTVSPVSP